jgi:hypothetical protein
METSEDEVVYSAFITLRNGKRLFAKNCGLKAFRFTVKKGNKKKRK